MRLKKLHLKAFGPFTDRVLDFGAEAKGLVLVHGPNEAGKSSALRAISDLRFGIPAQSTDNFVHEHPDMRVGGEFVDQQGKSYSLMRRKGRQNTLLVANFAGGGGATEEPALPAIERLLNCGLTKDAYDAMFGLDHSRLREGGHALLKGEGEIGAALFEASAGVRSIPEVIARLEASARKYFMPGARGKNARINEALAAYTESQTEFRRAQVRPAQWADLYHKHQTARAELVEMERRRAERHSKLLMIKELRAVAPVITTLDRATDVLRELKTIRLLSATSATDRAAAESGLADATHNANIAAAEVKRYQERLEELKLDTAILAVAPAVRRLAAAAETIDQYRKDIADAAAEAHAATEQLTSLAAQIDATCIVEALLDRAPAKAEVAAIDQQLHDLELAQQALDQQRLAANQIAERHEPELGALPSPTLRTALRVVQTEVTRSDQDLRRLATLPNEIKAAQRELQKALDAIGLADADALRRVKPLLDAQIDAALRADHEYATRRAGLESRIVDIGTAHLSALAQREQLMAKGAVPTPDEITAARAHRDTGWTLVRGTYIDGTKPAIDRYTEGTPLPEAYEAAVSRADRFADELSGDTERAAQLQAVKREIESLETDRTELVRQIDVIDREQGVRQAAWETTLREGNLPQLAPGALREWQTLLPKAHAATEKLQAKLDELDEGRENERLLAGKLRAAIVATGLAAPQDDETLSALSATAAAIEETIKQREATLNKVAGEKVERERQRQQGAALELKLEAALQAAKDALKPSLTRLLLPEDASVPVARARMIEMADLVEGHSQLSTLHTKKHRAEQGLSLLTDNGRAICNSLGQAELTDLRLFAEQAAARLDLAERVRAERTSTQQALDKAIQSHRDHEAAAGRHQGVLTTLCGAAGVASATQLPEAEENSRRKRQAQETVDHARDQLALASRRTVDELRALLSDMDAARMDADETTYQQEQSLMDEQLEAARRREETTRRELELVDSSDAAIAAHEAMERAASTVCSNMAPWIRSKIAHALLTEALRRFRDQAQGPMLKAASAYFERMTRQEFVRLLGDDSGKEPVLLAERHNGSRIHVEEMSEGTRDQLYLALRLAALDVRRAAGVDLPVIFDDVLMTSDEDRSGAILEALADFGRENQVIVFTHHRHIADVATKHVPSQLLTLAVL